MARKTCNYKRACHHAHSHAELAKFNPAYKKAMCDSWILRQTCAKGTWCMLAHSPQEYLLFVLGGEAQNPESIALYFTQRFHTQPCPFPPNLTHNGDFCHFYHHAKDKRRDPNTMELNAPTNVFEITYHPLNYAHHPCHRLIDPTSVLGVCSYEIFCPFVHPPSTLLTPPPPVPSSWPTLATRSSDEWKWSHGACFVNVDFIPLDIFGAPIPLDSKLATHSYIEFIFNNPKTTFGHSVATLRCLRDRLQLGNLPALLLLTTTSFLLACE